MALTRKGGRSTVPSSAIPPLWGKKALAAPIRWPLTARASAPASRSSWTMSIMAS